MMNQMSLCSLLSYKKIISALLIFFLVFILCGVLYKNIGHDSDAYGLVFWASKKNISFNIFKEATATVYYPLNELPSGEPAKATFMSQYRPLQPFMFHICYSLFGVKAYGYLLVQAFFHALTSAFIFLIFAFFCSNLWAFLLALAFAFHPSLFTSYLGLTCTIIPVFVLLSLAVLLFVLYEKLNKKFLYYLSAFCYFISLFFYEMPIVFPFIILLYLLFFDIKNTLKKSWLFFVATFCYLGLRFLLLGGGGASKYFGGFLDVKSRIITALINWHQAIKPFWGFQNFSKVLVGLFSGVFALLVLFYLIYECSDKRKKMFFYLISFFIASWVITIGNASSRYFYPAIPFFCLIFFELLNFSSRIFPQKMRKIIVALGLVMFILWGGNRAYTSLKNREEYTHKRDLAFMKIADKYKDIDDLRLIYLGALHFYNGEIFLMQSGATQASRLFFNNPELLAYHVSESKIYIKNDVNKNFDIYPISEGYRFVSPDPENIFIMCPYTWDEGDVIEFSMGKIKVNKKLSGWQATDVTFIFDEKWINKSNINNTVILTWDVVNWKFIELDKSQILSL